MAGDGLDAAVRGLPPPWRATFLESVDSTQDEARKAAGRGAPDRTLFVADFQRAGRGRQGRSWLAPPGTALLMSMLFRDPSAKPVPFRWTSLAAVSLVEAIAGLVPDAHPRIKWPNDVLVDGRKVAGVLAESAWNGLELTIVVGVGVNVSVDAQVLEPFGATSLNGAVDRGDLLRAFVQRLDAWLARTPDQLRQRWERCLWGRGQRVRLLDLGREEEAVVLGTEPDGSLRVRLQDGSERVTSTGELIL